MDADYIKDLSKEEKLAFISIFCRLIKADGNIDEDEVRFLKTTAAHFGVDNSAVVDIIRNAGSIDCVQEARKITGRHHALQLIKELCVLANVDNELHDAELDIIIDCAEAMKVEEQKVILINRWVLDNRILDKVGKIMLEED